MKHWAIYSPSENAFWNNQDGWTANVSDASPLSGAEKIRLFNNLPITKDGDARWVEVKIQCVLEAPIELEEDQAEREALLDALIKDDIGTIRDGIERNDVEYLADILLFGVSYSNQSTSQLRIEASERQLVG